MLLEELTDVITRLALTRRLAAIGKTAREVLADYLEAIELVEPVAVPRVVAAAPPRLKGQCASTSEPS